MKYKKGDKVKIVDEMHGHGFQNGDIVEIIKVNGIDDIGNGDYRVKGLSDSWWVRDEEIELVD